MKNVNIDYYEALGLEKSATKEEIKTAYRVLSKKYHPDYNSSANASALFRMIQESYNTLYNDKLREEYDNINNNVMYEVEVRTQGFHDEEPKVQKKEKNKVIKFFSFIGNFVMWIITAVIALPMFLFLILSFLFTLAISLAVSLFWSFMTALIAYYVLLYLFDFNLGAFLDTTAGQIILIIYLIGLFISNVASVFITFKGD